MTRTSIVCAEFSFHVSSPEGSLNFQCLLPLADAEHVQHPVVPGRADQEAGVDDAFVVQSLDDQCRRLNAGVLGLCIYHGAGQGQRDKYQCDTHVPEILK